MNALEGLHTRSQFARPTAEPYTRQVLQRDASHEIMLARWLADAECAPHDHGAAGGFVCVLDGRFLETHWAMRNGQLEAIAQRTLSAGDEARVTRTLIHSMRALTAGTTLHLYTPSISGMRVFDLHTRETLVVSDDCGAWVPEERAHVRTRMTWDAVKR